MGRRSDINWEAIERDFRAGQLSVREIAAKHDVAPSSITRKAEAKGWERDLSGDVQTRTKAKLLGAGKQQSNAQSAQDATPAERAKQAEQAVEEAAATNVQVILNHRQDLSKARALTTGMLDELATAAEKKAPLAKRAPIIKQLTDAMRLQQALERQAFGIVGEESDQPEHLVNAIASAAGNRTLSDAERAVRLARLIAATPVPEAGAAA